MCIIEILEKRFVLTFLKEETYFRGASLQLLWFVILIH